MVARSRAEVRLLPKESPPLEDLLTLEEVGKILGVGREKVYWLINHQGLPVVPLGKARKVRPSALSAWIAEQEASRQGA